MAITEISVSKIYVLATEPTNKVKDRFWFDTTNNLLKRYDGTTWKPISVSSDDVVVLSSGNKVSLTNYLNTQIAALTEGIDTKQDKLKYFQESTTYGRVGYPTENNPSVMVYSTPTKGINLTLPTQQTELTLKSKNISMSILSGTTNEGVNKFNKAILSPDGFTITGNVILNDTVSGNAISTSIPATVAAASDNKLLSEKATVSALTSKQDKLTTYKESKPSDTSYNKQVRIEADGGIFINGGEVGTVFENQFQVKAQAVIIDLEGGQFNIKADEFCLSANSLSGSTTIVSAISSTPRDNKIPTEKAVADALSTKQNKLTKYTETTNSATIDENYIFDGYNFQITAGRYIQLYDADFITNFKQKSIEVTEAYEGAGDTTFEIKNNTKITGNLNYTGTLQKDGVDVLASKQNSTDTTLNTTDKTIVGAINELLASINTNVITSTEQKRITTTSTSAGIQMSTTAKACMVSINPVKTNVGAIYISTSSDTAPTINPLYPDQMPKYKFPNASQVYIWSGVNGDSVDLTIEYYG